MPVFPSIEGEPGLDKVFRRFPHTVMPLLEYHDRLLRDPSPLTVAERELIAAYVSGINSCTYCHGAHVVAARFRRRSGPVRGAHGGSRNQQR